MGTYERERRTPGFNAPRGLESAAAVAPIDRGYGRHLLQGYIVESPAGVEHFLKAIDFSAALTSADPARMLQILTEAFNLERDILDISKTLSRVVTVVDGGTVVAGAPPETVQYLVLELAENSLRRMAVTSRRLPMSLALKALHNVATGLRQLHGKQVAHQDMKPSNALQFSDGEFKVCDVGRASIKGRAGPHDGMHVAGDRSYDHASATRSGCITPFSHNFATRSCSSRS